MSKIKIITRLLKTRLITHTPFILQHRVTSRCNAKCKFCKLWQISEQYNKDLSTKEIFDILKKANNAGMIEYIACGGEPLLREDIPEILQFAKELGFYTLLATNGMLLKTRYKEIARYTDRIAVSIDSIGEKHNKIRGVNGLFDKAIEGIKEVSKQQDSGIAISTVISNLNIDRVEDLIELSSNLGVPINFTPMEVYPGYNEEFMPDKKTLRDSILKILEFKNEGFLIENSKEYLKIIGTDELYKCHMPKITLEIDPQGNPQTCFDYSWDSIKNMSFKELFQSKEYQEYRHRAEGCNTCSHPSIVEMSIAYSFNLKVFRNIAKILR